MGMEWDEQRSATFVHPFIHSYIRGHECVHGSVIAGTSQYLHTYCDGAHVKGGRGVRHQCFVPSGATVPAHPCTHSLVGRA